MKKPTTYTFRRIARWGVWLCAALSFATGCSTVDENTDDCFTLSRLQFLYTYNLYGEDRFSEQVENIDIFAYAKSDSMFVTSKRLTYSEITSPKGASLSWLPMGDYILVVYGNLHPDDYDCHGYEGHLLDMRTAMICMDRQGTIINDNPVHLFHGIMEIARQDIGVKTVELTKSTSDIVIVINDLTPANQGTRALGPREMEAQINAVNGSINHDNTLSDEDTRQMKHITTLSAGSTTNKYTSTTTVGRLLEGDGTTFTVVDKESSEVLVSENLTDKILELLRTEETDMQYAGMHSNEYLERQDTFRFEYNLELRHGVLVTTLVSVNDWNPVGPGGGGDILW